MTDQPHVRIITDPAEAIEHLVKVIRLELSIFHAMEDVAGAETYIAGFETQHGRDLAASIWRAHLAKYRKDGSRYPYPERRKRKR